MGVELMKKIILIFFATFVVLFMSACKPYTYNGKEIESLKFVDIDYFGDYRHESIIDLQNGEVLHRQYSPEIPTPDYEIDFTFDTSEVDSFLDEFGSSGIFNLKEEYHTIYHVDDGGGWIFTIYYSDGTEKTSTGDNYWLTKVFEKAGTATINLYGDNLFDPVH